MENTARKIVTLDQAKVVGHIQLPPQSQPSCPSSTPAVPPTASGSFLCDYTGFAADSGQLCREHSRVIHEIFALQAENRWQDIIELFHPVDDKVPELVAAGMEIDIRAKVAFALVRLHRAEEAIATLLPAAERQPDDAMIRYTIGYAALDELFTARTERRIIPGKRKKELINLAHDHFAAARALRPESVTFCYREAILYKEIEGKTKLAAPLFEQAIANWERQSPQEQEQHHQQRPKYVKSLFHLASCLLDARRASRSLQLLQQLEQEDRDRNYLHPLFRHFAMGKVLHALNRDKEALEHLETAGHVAEPHQPTDFVWELAARCALRLQQVDRAGGYVAKVPAHRRRPFVRWTEADVLAASGRVAEAMQVLRQCGERDRRSRHVSLIRLSRLLLGQHSYEQAQEAAVQAVRFCEETYGNPAKEALFWQAACLHLLGRNREAREILATLEEGHFQYPHFRRLVDAVRAASAAPAAEATGTDPMRRTSHDNAAVNQ